MRRGIATLCAALIALAAGPAVAAPAGAAAVDHRNGELSARASPAPKPVAFRAGLYELGDGPGPTKVYVPANAEGSAAPLLLLLHGAGGGADSMLERFKAQADRHGMILVVPSSRDRSWDIITSGVVYNHVRTKPSFGPDVKQIDAALKQVFANYAVDPNRVAIAGFSDGGSYALSLGINNGGVFRHIIAFSPGFVAPTRGQGKPRIFVSHGTTDKVLPISTTSRWFVPRLKQGGFNVLLREFDGGHRLPKEVEEEAFAWYLNKAADMHPAGR